MKGAKMQGENILSTMASIKAGDTSFNMDVFANITFETNLSWNLEKFAENSYLIVTHKSCADGALSAALFIKFLQLLYSTSEENFYYEVIEISYGKNDLEVIMSNRMMKSKFAHLINIVMVDYCIDYEDYLSLIKMVSSVTVFDHHQRSDISLDSPYVIHDKNSSIAFDFVTSHNGIPFKYWDSINSKIYLIDNESGCRQIYNMIQVLTNHYDTESFDENGIIETLVITVDKGDLWKELSNAEKSLLNWFNWYIFDTKRNHIPWINAYEAINQLLEKEFTNLAQEINIGASIVSMKENFINEVVSNLTVVAKLDSSIHEDFIDNPKYVLVTFAPRSIRSETGNYLALNYLHIFSKLAPDLTIKDIIPNLGIVMTSPGKFSVRSCDGAITTALDFVKMFGTTGGHEHSSGMYASLNCQNGKYILGLENVKEKAD